MSKPQNDPLLQLETTCGSLLYELQIIWDEVGEPDTERDKMLLELERECLEVYRRKVDQANRSRAQLRQAIADYEAELAAICSAMAERPVHIRQSDQKAGSLKHELARILPELEEMRKRKSERRDQFKDVQEKILNISNEIYGSKEYISPKTVVDESDLSLRKLEELHGELQTLQKEKIERLKKVQDYLCTLDSLCSVLGFDFKQIVSNIHPSLGDTDGPKSVTDDTIQQLAAAIQNLREVKLQRMQKLQDLATTMLELWDLMDTPVEEQQMFQSITCNVAASESEITEPNTLSVDVINYVEAEVCRLNELKASKMKELVLKKRTELEEICRKVHLVPVVDNAMDFAVEAIESGSVDPAYVLEQIELQISKVKEEAFSRKEILEKVEKWLAACDEESWLEEYNRDDNRYNAGRGAHLTLKRAEKARALVNKLPAMVDALASKTVAWEKEKGMEFTYDGIRLLSMLEEYTILREEKEQERRRQRDLKKLQGQLIAEQEALYGSKPSPSKAQGGKKAPRMSTGGAASRRVSLGGAMVQTPKTQSRPARKTIDNHLDDSISSLSSVRRGLDIAGGSVKKQSFGGGGATGGGSGAGRDMQSPMMRQPFSPIASALSSKANMKNPTDELNNNNNTHSEKLQKAIIAPTNTIMPFSTPSKAAPIMADDENRTPKTVMPIPFPSTPSTVSAPMNMAVTPAPPPPPPAMVVPLAGDFAPEIEYSFEERRLAFILSS